MGAYHDMDASCMGMTKLLMPRVKAAKQTLCTNYHAMISFDMYVPSYLRELRSNKSYESFQPMHSYVIDPHDDLA